MMRLKTINSILTVVSVSLLVTSCACDGKKSGRNTQIIDSLNIDEKLMDEFSKSKLIFYSLPSPLETAMLIKKAGVEYNASILNPLENISKYTTNRQMALKLGGLFGRSELFQSF
ncbi:MAG: hypothetical protein QM786_12425 [Breznakibacter sp.]